MHGLGHFAKKGDLLDEFVESDSKKKCEGTLHVSSDDVDPIIDPSH